MIDRQTLSCTGTDVQKPQQLELSDWLTRLCTYEEACLAGDKLFCMFADGLTPASRFHRAMTGKNNNVREEITRNKLHVYIGTGFVQLLCGPSRFMVNVSHLHKRTTTKAHDEAICLATLNEIDVNKLPSKPTLIDLFKHMTNTLPEDIIFTDGPGSNAPGFRWSPTSFLSRSTLFYPPSQKAVELRPDGLCVIEDVAFIFHDINIHSPDLTSYWSM